MQNNTPLRKHLNVTAAQETKKELFTSESAFLPPHMYRKRGNVFATAAKGQ